MWPPFNSCRLDLFSGSKCIIEDFSTASISQLRTNEGTSLAWLHMLKLDDRPEIAVPEQRQPIPEITCIGHRSLSCELCVIETQSLRNQYTPGALGLSISRATVNSCRSPAGRRPGAIQSSANVASQLGLRLTSETA
jgi:hypothetical protein